MYFGPVDGDSAASLFEDLADLFEQAAADGTPIREIVGEDPVEFVEALFGTTRRADMSTGSGSGWSTPSRVSREKSTGNR